MKNFIVILILSFSSISWTQTTTNIRVKGYLFDQTSSEPIPFVKIENKSTKTVSISSFEGYFEIELNSIDDTIISSHYDYKTLQLKDLNLNDTLQIFLNRNFTEIDEVVVKPSDNTQLYLLLTSFSKRHYLTDKEAKAYFVLKSYLDSSQIELVEAYYNAEIKGYDVSELKIKTGRIAVKPTNQNRIFANLSSSKAICELRTLYENQYFPVSPFELNYKKLRKFYNLELISTYVNERKDSICVINFYPKASKTDYFKGKVWLNITKLSIDKLDLENELCTNYPFLPLFPMDSIQNVNLHISKTFHTTSGSIVLDKIEFNYSFDYLSRTDREEKAKYTIQSKALVYFYDYSNLFTLPVFQFEENVNDYRKVHALPYLSRFCNSNSELKMNDQTNETNSFYSDKNAFTNQNLFDLKLFSKNQDSTKRQKTDFYESKYIHWSKNRVLLKEMEIDTLTQRLSSINSLNYQISVQVFSDFIELKDSSYVITETIIDPFFTYYYLPVDKYTNCFINLYFDLCEIERRKFEKELKVKGFNQQKYLQLRKKFDQQLEAKQAQFLKEVERGTNRKALEKWNQLVFDELKIDNITLFGLYTEKE
ncbi:MAG: carboxypeptidase-like regulatory domain-containing protein [Fluviicola sp.]